MEHSVGLYQLSIQQDIPPAPNEDPKAVDWLPLFAGFGWLAYGAQYTVVISMAPSPSNTGEAAMGGFFRQVLSTDWPTKDSEKDRRVSSVSWAPSGISVGTLAASAAQYIYVYTPKGASEEEYSERLPEIPLQWVKAQTLEHASDVLSFSWTESGDGLLSVGREIVLWQRGQENWTRLWQSEMERPQSLSAASWAARGIAATSEGTCSEVAENEGDDEDHQVKIWWWWEDGQELQEIDLSHPQRLLSIQWRPMRGFCSSSTSFRPVLMTCCQDGVVRLWAEIGNLGEKNSSAASSDPTAAAGDAERAHEAEFKLAFFVSAVIDVNSILKGILGKNIHVTWPEARGGGLRSPASDRDDSSDQIYKEIDLLENEWLIGIGPYGSVAFWSVQSLDDLSPARGPLLQLWRKKPGLLPVPSMSHADNIEGESCPHAIKAVIHRPHGTIWAPPSSLDLLEIWSPHRLRWSCIWPPVAAIGGSSSRNVAPGSGTSTVLATGGKTSPWGVSSETVVLGGHEGNILQVAVHPIAAIRLVASLDDHGTILLWDSTDSSFNPRIEITGFVNPLWKSSGQMEGHQINCAGPFNSVAWAPVIFPEDDAVLLLGYSRGVDCVLMSRKVSVSKGKSRSFSISHKLLHTVEWPLLDDAQGLQGIYTVPSQFSSKETPHLLSCTIVGVGGSGRKLAAWKLNIDIGRERQKGDRGSHQEFISKDDPSKAVAIAEEVSVQSEDLVPSDIMGATDMDAQSIVMDDRLLGFSELRAGEQVTSIGVSTAEHQFGRHLVNRNDVNDVCDVITGCADGRIKLWKIWDGGSGTGKGGWQCVGSLEFCRGPVTKVAVCCGGSRIASSGRLDGEGMEEVHIWGADALIEERGFCLEERILLSSKACTSLAWLDGGNGLPILGVATQNEVQLFSECRKQIVRWGERSNSGPAELNAWSCLASSSLTGFSTSTLSWDPQGSLIVTRGGHILLCSDCVLPVGSWTTASGNPDLDRVVMSGSNQSAKVEGLSSYAGFLTSGNGSNARLPVRPDEADKIDEENGFCSILEAAEKIGCPLLDYHPTSVLSWICGGDRQYARAAVRHLASYLVSSSNSLTSQTGSEKGTRFADFKSPELKVSRTPLSKIFQEREQSNSSHQQNTSASFTTQQNRGFERGWMPEYLNTSSKDFSSDFMTFGSNYSEKHESAGMQLNIKDTGGLESFTKAEVEAISKAIRGSLKIPGLSTAQKVQLLAIIGVLAEMDGVGQAAQTDSLDLPGQRLWIAFRYSVHLARLKSEGESNEEMPVVQSKVIAWALQSDSKGALLDLCLPDQSASWTAMRAIGMGYWFVDGTELRTKMEKLARAQYLSRKDPKDCALLYVALDRRHVLSGLFKLSKDAKDKPLSHFFLRDFKDEKHQAAALKNAYVLMGKHRHELAAAFFILGGDNKSAAVVCAKNLADTQLALVICSLVEGANGPIRREIITKYALPTARDTGDIWLASLLQWLLGEGIESVLELTVQRQNLSIQPLQNTKSSSEGFNRSPAFPLDPDIGKYCELLASKPRLRKHEPKTEAVTLARIASASSATALKRAGLSLQVLDYVRGSRYANLSTEPGQGDEDRSYTSFSSISPSGEVLITDIDGREVGHGWLSTNVVAGLRRATRLSLVRQCASQLLQGHPHWGGQMCRALQPPDVSGSAFGQKGKVNSYQNGTGETTGNTPSDGSEKTVDASSVLEEADKSCDSDLQLMNKRYLIGSDEIAAALCTFTHIHHRPYLLHRLLQGLGSFTEPGDTEFHLASQSSLSMLAARYLEVFGTEAPHVLARTVLSCGGGAAAAASLELSSLGVLPTQDAKVPSNYGGLSGFPVEELVRFGGEILRLTKAASHESPLFAKERGARAMSLLSYIFFVAAAWLGRQPETLYALIASTVIDPSTAPGSPPGDHDAVLWFRRLHLFKSSVRAPDYNDRGKKPLENFGLNLAGTARISADDARRVLGVMLWTHLLIYVKKQLSGMASEAVYSSLGQMSSSLSQSFMKPSVASSTKGSTFLGFNFPSSALSSTWLDFKSKVRDSHQAHQTGYQPVSVAGANRGSVGGGADFGSVTLDDEKLSSATDNDDFGVALLSSITSIVAGLRKELAAHLEHSLNRPEADGLTLWLWGKPAPAPPKKPPTGGNALNFFGATTSSGLSRGPVTSTGTAYPQIQPVRFPTAVIEMENKVWTDLWEMLAVREKVRSALGLEGVTGPRRNLENGNLSGWYLGRKARMLTPQTSLDRTGANVNANGKHRPKRVMWNAVKGLPPVSDQGVVLSSRREEENAQSRSPASNEDVHLSEEFTEVVYRFLLIPSLYNTSSVYSKLHMSPPSCSIGVEGRAYPLPSRIDHVSNNHQVPFIISGPFEGMHDLSLCGFFKSQRVVAPVLSLSVSPVTCC